MYKVVGDYQLKEKIGKGNFADVYLGTHRSTGAKYAIKAISKELFVEPKLLAGLENEIRIMKDLTHPNIIQLYKYFSSEKNFYLVVEYCAGGDLSKYIRKKGQLGEIDSLNFLCQIAEGIHFLHDNRFIHRDLKPANVLLCEAADDTITLKLADFGFARTLNIASLAQTRCGTPLYMAPEILEAKEYDGKADIWSIGCIFYEMLVGTCPFKGINEADLLNNIRSKNLRIPSSIEVSRLSFDILVKLLERTASRRASTEQLISITRRIQSEMAVVRSSTSRMNTSSTALPGSSSTSSSSRAVSGGITRSNSHEKLHNPSSSSKTTPSISMSSSGKEGSGPSKKVSEGYGTVGPTHAAAVNVETKYTEDIQRMRTASQEIVQSPPPSSSSSSSSSSTNTNTTNNSTMNLTNHIPTATYITPSTGSAKLGTPPLHMSNKGTPVPATGSVAPQNNHTTPSTSLQTMFPSVDDPLPSSAFQPKPTSSSLPMTIPLSEHAPPTQDPGVQSSNGGAVGGEEDFVIIDPGKEDMSGGEVPFTTGKGPNQVQGSAAYWTNAMGSMFAAMTGGTGSGPGTAGLSSPSVTSFPPTTSHPLYASGGMAALSEFRGLASAIFARCDLYCDTIQAITLLGDQLVQKHASPAVLGRLFPTTQPPPPSASQLTHAIAADERELGPLLAVSTPSDSYSPNPLDAFASFASHATPLAVNPNNQPQLQQQQLHAPSVTNVEQRIEEIMLASQLYSHAVTILQHLILSLQQYPADIFPSISSTGLNASSSLPTQAQPQTNLFSKLLTELTSMFGHLIQRIEYSQQLMDHLTSILLSRYPTASLPTMTQKQLLLPKCEYYMLQHALHAENDGHTEELLGHMGKAYNHYLLAKKLIQGVTLTYVHLEEDPEWNHQNSSNNPLVSLTASSGVKPAVFSQKRVIAMQLHSYLESMEQKLSACFAKCQLLQGFGIEDVDNFAGLCHSL